MPQDLAGSLKNPDLVRDHGPDVVVQALVQVPPQDELLAVCLEQLYIGRDAEGQRSNEAYLVGPSSSATQARALSSTVSDRGPARIPTKQRHQPRGDVGL